MVSWLLAGIGCLCRVDHLVKPRKRVEGLDCPTDVGLAVAGPLIHGVKHKYIYLW